jgi:hypothetical protein
MVMPSVIANAAVSLGQLNPMALDCIDGSYMHPVGTDDHVKEAE